MLALLHDHMGRRTVENPDLAHRAARQRLSSKIREMEHQGYTVLERAISPDFADEVRNAVSRVLLPHQTFSMNWMLYHGREFDQIATGNVAVARLQRGRVREVREDQHRNARPLFWSVRQARAMGEAFDASHLIPTGPPQLVLIRLIDAENNARIRQVLAASRAVLVERDGPVMVYDVDIRSRKRRDSLVELGMMYRETNGAAAPRIDDR